MPIGPWRPVVEAGRSDAVWVNVLGTRDVGSSWIPIASQLTLSGGMFMARLTGFTFIVIRGTGGLS